jgi:hypothetical protein
LGVFFRVKAVAYGKRTRNMIFLGSPIKTLGIFATESQTIKNVEICKWFGVIKMNFMGNYKLGFELNNVKI